MQLNTIPPQTPLTIDKLNLKMIENFGDKDQKRDIKYFLNNKLNFSYRRKNFKPKAFSSNRNKSFQVIYSSKMLRNINNDKYLINIDEASFNRSLKK